MEEGDSGVQIFSLLLGLAILALIGLFANGTEGLAKIVPKAVTQAAAATGAGGTQVAAPPVPAFAAIPDQYTTLPQVTQALRRAGLEASELVSPAS